MAIFQYGRHQFLRAFWPFQIFIQMIPVSYWRVSDGKVIEKIKMLV